MGFFFDGTKQCNGETVQWNGKSFAVAGPSRSLLCSWREGGGDKENGRRPGSRPLNSPSINQRVAVTWGPAAGGPPAPTARGARGAGDSRHDGAKTPSQILEPRSPSAMFKNALKKWTPCCDREHRLFQFRFWLVIRGYKFHCPCVLLSEDWNSSGDAPRPPDESYPPCQATTSCLLPRHCLHNLYLIRSQTQHSGWTSLVA